MESIDLFARRGTVARIVCTFGVLVALRGLQGNVRDISLVLTVVLHDQCGDMYWTVL